MGRVYQSTVCPIKLDDADPGKDIWPMFAKVSSLPCAGNTACVPCSLDKHSHSHRQCVDTHAHQGAIFLPSSAARCNNTWATWCRALDSQRNTGLPSYWPRLSARLLPNNHALLRRVDGQPPFAKEHRAMSSSAAALVCVGRSSPTAKQQSRSSLPSCGCGTLWCRCASVLQCARHDVQCQRYPCAPPFISPLLKQACYGWHRKGLLRGVGGDSILWSLARGPRGRLAFALASCYRFLGQACC